MRLGFAHFGLAGLALSLAACSGPETKDRAAELGCGVIDGIASVSGTKPASYIIVGEVIETNEAPAAFAELACRLAAEQPEGRKLWVGLPERIGGATGADLAMRKRLADLIAKGAPIALGDSGTGHTTGASGREDAERRWAFAITQAMEEAGADRTLLLVSRRDGVATRIVQEDRRLEDYTPMALFLPDDEMVNLEIGQANGIGPPTIRIYLSMNRGYMGQIALESVTLAERPGATPAEPVRE